jgi:hypothetical protein
LKCAQTIGMITIYLLRLLRIPPSWFYDAPTRVSFLLHGDLATQ